MPVNLLEQQTREKAGQGPEWGVFLWEQLPEAKGMLLTGAIAPLLLSGKFKGKPNWKKRDLTTERRVFISYVEQATYEAKWEAETGKCARCEGEGKTVAGWSREAGQTYRSCVACNGTGAAKVTEGATL